MSYTPYNAPLLGPILGDDEAAAFFGVKADIQAMLKFEAALAQAQAQLGMISSNAADEIMSVIDAYQPDIKGLQTAIARDGLVVPELIKRLRSKISDKNAGSLHFHCTSQDVIDTSAMMRMQKCTDLIEMRLSELSNKLISLHKANGQNSFMAHTRMQAALPTTASDRIGLWADPIPPLLKLSKDMAFPVQLSGPIGSAKAYEGNAKQLIELIAQELALDIPELSWQANRSPVLKIAEWLVNLSAHLGKIGTDIALMAQMGEDQIVLSGGGGSSAMAHKKNPVLAETLITLARFNATQISGMHHAMLHEQERSGSAWMLEWMIMPQIFVTTAAALRNTNLLIESIERIGSPT